MSTFKPEEMEAMRRGGNQAARDLYLAKWTPKDFPEPESGEVEKIRQFMKVRSCVYVCVWMGMCSYIFIEHLSRLSPSPTDEVR